MPIGFIRASARPSTSEHARTIRTGIRATDATCSGAGAESPAGKPGNSGQVIRAASTGVALVAIIAAVCIVIAQ
jgi:hypothetical protein